MQEPCFLRTDTSPGPLLGLTFTCDNITCWFWRLKPELRVPALGRALAPGGRLLTSCCNLTW